MRIVTKKEWDNTPEENKRVYNGTPYMLYREGERTCFGPVRVIEGEKIMDFRKFVKYIKKNMTSNNSLQNRESKLNCWEFFHCGREQEGDYYTCPAARDTSGDGINSGKNCGRICWSLFGTFCGRDKNQDTKNSELRTQNQEHEYEEGRLTCGVCEFFKLVKREEGDQFSLLRPGQTTEEIDEVISR